MTKTPPPHYIILGMSCYHPYKLFDVGDRTPDGKIKYFMAPFYFDEIRKKNGVFTREYKVARCGKCIGCRLDKAKEWSVRCVLESKYHEYNYFITLTYEDNNEASLIKKDLQDFLKRIRKRIYCRYFGCGEYGEQSMRRHFHLLLFCDDPIEDLKYWYNRNGKPTYKSDWLTERWSHGLVDITTFSYKTAGYVARYCCKKMNTDNRLFEGLDLEAPYIVMSRRPGIGAQFFKDHKEIYECDELFISNEDTVIKTKPPFYFDKLLEKIDPDLLTQVKEARELNGFLSQAMFKADIDYESYLQAQERSKLKSIKKLNRGGV